MTSAKDRDFLVKIAVQMDNQLPQLIPMDKRRPLELIVQDLCVSWSIPTQEHNDYALRFLKENEVTNYVTEKNRHEIKDGCILKLTNSPSIEATNILDKIRSTSGETRRHALIELVKQSQDATFANEFINSTGKENFTGKDYLIKAVEEGTIKSDEGLGEALEALVELMNHGIVTWDSVTELFVSKVASQINLSANLKTDPKILIKSLAILENIISSSIQLATRVEEDITLPNLINHVQHSANQPEIQLNAITLINALFAKSDLSKRKSIARTLGSRHIRNVILNSVISKTGNENDFDVGSEMAHQLFILQSLIFNLHEERMQAMPDDSANTEADSKEKLNELRKLAFDNEQVGGVSISNSSSIASDRKPLSHSSSLNASSYFENFVRLGFTCCKNPIEDFNRAPAGLLSLDLMLYFARNYTDSFAKVVLENSCRSDKEHECPFARSSIEITLLLCQLLKIGESPSDEGKCFYRLSFTHDHPLEELFCICVPLLNKTWKEMRATVADFEKVFTVLRQQLTRAFDDRMATASFEKLKEKLSKLTYNEIMNLWQKERSNREEWENKAKSILELREKVKPEILELIKQQRLQMLTDGTIFAKYSNKGTRVKDKFWFCRLSNNYKVFHYGDAQENKIPSIEELPHKLPVVDINRMITGRDCPHMKDQKSKKSTSVLAFSLMPDSDQEESLNFVAPNEKIFDYWTDGLNALLGQPMISKEAGKDLDILLSMDIKLRLLDIEGITIPEVPPEVPPSPPNYDFNFKY